MESTPQEEAEGHAIVRVLAVVLERLVSANSHLAPSEQEETKFHALRAPAIGILQYLERIHKYASCSKECFILALIYIDRLIQRNNFPLTELNVHRVVITAVLLAAKFFDDAYYNNAYYAKVGGVLVSEMNTLEVEFLFKIDFGLRVPPEVFERYRDELISHSSAVGLDSIARCTDEELYCQGQSHGQQQQQQQQQLAQAAVNQIQQNISLAPQEPLLQNYSRAELVNQVAFGNPAPAPQLQEQHYPIQALHQSMAALAPLQQYATANHLQHQQTQAALEQALFPFPSLAAQVSARQRPLEQPTHVPSELDLVYHNLAPAAAVAARHSITPAAAPQDPSLSQYLTQHHLTPRAAPQHVTLSQYSHMTPVADTQDATLSRYSTQSHGTHMTVAQDMAQYASQAQLLQAQPRQEVGMDGLYPQQQAQAPAYSRASLLDSSYYSDPAPLPAPVAPIPAAPVAPAYPHSSGYALADEALAAVLRAAQAQRGSAGGHPEITPSPPPQPAISIYGAPSIGAYQRADARQSGAYLKPPAAALSRGLAYAPSADPTGLGYAALPAQSGGYAVGGCGSWSRMVSIEGGPAADGPGPL